MRFLFFFFNDTATTEIYTLSLHDALPIWHRRIDGPDLADQLEPAPAGHLLVEQHDAVGLASQQGEGVVAVGCGGHREPLRSEEHTSELQSRLHLVCRLLLEKKKKNKNNGS